MSNENSSTNHPRQKNYYRVGSAPSSGRSRKFSCITYLSELQLQTVLLAHSTQIRVYAYAYHDKDLNEDGELKEPHIHLVLVTYCTCSISAVRRWFSGRYDSKNKEITTTAQICSNVFQMYDYLTHNTKEAILEGKYQYDKRIIKTNDKSNYFQAGSESEFDNITIAAEMLIKGSHPRDLGKIFGRDFILHYNTIKNYANDVLHLQQYNLTFHQLLEREYQQELEKLNNGK